MEKRKLVDSFNSAIEGFVFVLKSQRNMRLHFITAGIVMLLGIYLNLSKTELLLLSTAITFVLISEMFNTAVELIIDLITDTFHPLARIIKDITAGCVLIAAINSVLVGYLVFSKFIFASNFSLNLMRLKQSPWHITFLSLILVLVLVILGKTFFGKGKPLRGGMPSGHSAIAFSIWTIVALTTSNRLLIILCFLLSALIAQSRAREKIHTVSEVLLGSLLGILTTLPGRKWPLALAPAIAFFVLVGQFLMVFFRRNGFITAEFVETVVISLSWILGVGVLLGTVLAFVAARRREYIGNRTVWLSVAFWIALSVFSVNFWRQGMDVPFACFYVLVAVLPLTPLATASLALSWNRHR